MRKVEGKKGGRLSRWRLSLSRTRRDTSTQSREERENSVVSEVAGDNGMGLGELDAVEMV